MPAAPNQLADVEFANHFRHAFYVIFIIDMTFCSMIFADTIGNEDSQNNRTSVNYSMPPLGLTLAAFAVGSAAKLLGLVGVIYQRISYISIYASVSLLLTIVHLVWVGSLTQLLVLGLDLVLAALGLQIRSMFMGSWFSASR
mmetsp:Transcript_19355/g.53740  ORF Transcript_19355/g.53740 Transcript_19355/m.53740 type:complete len:142 (-) Transcript_19355:98-523(-)